MREDLIKFLNHLRDRGYELAKLRQLNSSKFAWLPITDILYEQKIEDIVDSYIAMCSVEREG